MSGFGPLVERATRRLSRDHELRGEVSRELASHLAASAAEYRSAGYAEPDADAAAAKDFGDPDDVADDLWQANRFRLSLRAWGWWAARATLLPACVLALAAFAVSGVSLVRSYQLVEWLPSSNPDWVERWQQHRLRSRMTATQQLIYFGDETADTEVGRARGRRDALPEDPRYQLDLIDAIRVEMNRGLDETSDPVWAREGDVLRKELARGATLDPGNGIYALVDAGLHARTVRTVRLENEDEAADATAGTTPVEVRVLRPDANEPREAVFFARLAEGVDRDAVDATIRGLREAAEHPFVSLRHAERGRHRIDQLPPPRSMIDVVNRLAAEIGVLLPALGDLRQTARIAVAEALRLAERGEPDAASAILDDLDAVNARLAASSDILIELLVAWSMESLARSGRVGVHRLAGDETAAAVALQHHDEMIRVWRREWVAYRDTGRDCGTRDPRAGVLMNQLSPAVPGLAYDVAPFRAAEHTLLDRAALTVGLLGLVAVAGLAALQGLWSRWRRGVDGAWLLWIGWRRLGSTLAVALGLPVFALILWFCLPMSGRSFGLNHTLAPIAAYAVAGVWAFGLLWWQGSAAIRERAAVVGLAVPPAPRFRVTLAWLAVCTLTAVVGGVPLWNAHRVDWFYETFWAWALLVGLILSVLATAAWACGQAAWARGLLGTTSGRGLVRRIAWHGGLTTFVAAAALAGLGWWVAAPPDRVAFLILAGSVGLVMGLGLTTAWVASRPGPSATFGVSLVRSMVPVVASAALALVVVVGGWTVVRERGLAGRMLDGGGVFFREVERSQGRVLRAYLAGGAERPSVPE